MFIIGSNKLSVSVDFDNFLEFYKKIVDIDSLHSFIKEQPLFPEWREKIQKMEFIRAVQGTVALEGSDLEVKDVERIARQEFASTLDRDREAENALKAYDFIQEWSSNNQDAHISESVIKQIHAFMTRDISYYLNEPGEYRNQIVEFGNPRQRSELKDRFEVQDGMARLVDFLKLKETEVLKYTFHPITKAILAHYIITYIHPFIDGNGRVSRAIEALILYHYGKYEPYLFPVTAKFYYKERTKYFNLLRLVDTKGDPYPFINFAIDGLHKNLIEIKNHILDQITRTLILDYAHQLRRQKKLLKRQTTLLETMFYLGTMKSDVFWRHPAIKAIYSNFSDSTRKRDISKLLELDFVKYIESTSPNGKKIIEMSVNWDALSFVTIKLDVIPHRE